ncbi:MAG: putative Integral rane sensor signal transduction histidine kinase [Fibrobacteres bacterium]|nr:putative Integral rane sensor signal transduction histidine kinase [Fibrobacterota bacterium]
MLKMLLNLLATGLLVNVCVGGFWRMSFFRQTHAALERNVGHYAHFLAGEIGSPPDTAKALALASRYSLRITYHGPDGDWASGPGAAFPERNGHGTGSHLVPGDPGTRTGWSRHRFFVQVDHEGGRFTFATDLREMMDGHAGYLALLILLVSGVLACAWLAIRRLLTPLRGLTAAVERIRRGELGHQVPVCTRDELGDLARSFNAMSTGLQEMVRSREQLLLDVSHELRSPLTRIKLALEMGPEGMAKESIRDDVGEMEVMISEILETARLDSANGKLNLEPVDLEDLVSEAVADADLRAPGARLVAGGGGSAAGPMVKADRMRVRKVLANILDNAVKFSQGKDAPVEVRIETGTAGATVRVKDKGVGIPEDELPRLFEPFYRVDRSRSRETGGYGLGLSLCRRIMEAHGGSISISSRVGEGTEVSLVFPFDAPVGP